MAGEPTYLIWTPRTSSQPGGTSAVRFNITPLSALDWPNGDEPFYTQLLRGVGVGATAKAWDVLPYRCRYHGNPDAGDWMDRWKRNWRVTIKTTASMDRTPTFEEGYETDAFAVAPPVPDGDLMHAFVLADFPDKERATRVQENLRGSSDKFASLEVFEVEASFWQIQVDLGPRHQSFFTGDDSDARHVEALCRRHGGWPTFDERVRALG